MSIGAAGRDFDELVAVYATLNHLTRDRVGEWLATMLPEKCDTAIDVGCGTGRHLQVLSPVARRVTGLDASWGMIRYARSCAWYPNVAFRVGDLGDVQGQYDAVVCVSVLHHCGDLSQGIAGLAGIVRPSGVAYIVEAVDQGPRNARVLKMVAAATRHFVRRIRKRDWTAFALIRAELSPGWLKHRMRDRFPSRSELRKALRENFGTVHEDEVGGMVACVCRDAVQRGVGAWAQTGDAAPD